MLKIKDKDIDNVYNAISESPKIQELIRNIAAEKIDLQKNAIEKCEFELTKKEKDIEKLKCNISSLENEKNNLSNELESANKTIEILKKKFETPITYFKLYQGLSNSVKSGLENVISDKSEIAFIVSCSSEENLSFI